jgi:hypothetical protein
MKTLKYNTHSRKTAILVQGFSRKKREEFKKEFKPYLKHRGVTFGGFCRKALIVAMKNPTKIV